MGDAPFLLLFHTIVESLAYLFSQDQIVVIHGVIGNGLQSTWLCSIWVKVSIGHLQIGCAYYSAGKLWMQIKVPELQCNPGTPQSIFRFSFLESFS